ncbi:MAG TPA: 50S ribosomal protein L22 [Candidatus Cloacimonadota bacterium]|nr:50S ribosomal protein L22 [Candidatus Cloacimonadota bacterium]HOV17265.1 50S ribosomal protein L22 [Candidatus Cloacimonadota bacterium]HQL14645.1 50S ribosomal protein L22 [Candidatus Cloacimonadota bacterium]
MEAKATLRFARGSARKARLVLDQIRNKRVTDAQSILSLSRKRASVNIGKLLASAVANAQVKDPKLDLNQVYVTKATADVGPVMKRYMPRAQGRAYLIRKQTCHISLEIKSLE